VDAFESGLSQKSADFGADGLMDLGLHHAKNRIG
jgi:hypothetical protein